MQHTTSPLDIPTTSRHSPWNQWICHTKDHVSPLQEAIALRWRHSFVAFR